MKGNVAAGGVWLLGVAFALAGTLKAMDLSSFHAQISRYDLLPEGTTGTAALFFVAVEIGLGLCCIAGFRCRMALWGLLVLLALLSGATLMRWSALQGTDCNCFGRLAGGGPSTVIIRNAVLASVTFGVLVVGKGSAFTYARRTFRTASGVAAVVAALFIAQPVGAGYRLSSGNDEAGAHIRIFLSATCKHCKESLGRVRDLAAAPALPSVQVFIGAENQKQITDFIGDAGLPMAYAPLTLHQLGSVVPRVPTVQIVRDGEVKREWSSDVPSVEEVTLEAHQLVYGSQ